MLQESTVVPTALDFVGFVAAVVACAAGCAPAGADVDAAGGKVDGGPRDGATRDGALAADRDAMPADVRWPDAAPDDAPCLVFRDVVVNGGFADGNTGFTTDLRHAPTSIYDAGTYAIGADPQAVHSAFPAQAAGWLDHSPDDGNPAMLANGSTDASNTVWSENVAAVAGTRYNFRAFVRSLHACPCASIGAEVRAIDGSGEPLVSNVAVTELDDWVEHTAIWTATETGPVRLVLTNSSTAYGGNDFAIDDIVFIAEEIPAGCGLI